MLAHWRPQVPARGEARRCGDGHLRQGTGEWLYTHHLHRERTHFPRVPSALATSSHLAPNLPSTPKGRAAPATMPLRLQIPYCIYLSISVPPTLYIWEISPCPCTCNHTRTYLVQQGLHLVPGHIAQAFRLIISKCRNRYLGTHLPPDQRRAVIRPLVKSPVLAPIFRFMSGVQVLPVIVLVKVQAHTYIRCWW